MYGMSDQIQGNAEEITKLKKEIEFLEEENKRLNDIIDILRETSRTND